MKGEDVKRLRSRIKKSQQWLADFMGYGDRGTVSNIERGKKGIGRTARKLLGLIPLYGADAPKLWDKQWAKRIKQLFREDGDGTSN